MQELYPKGRLAEITPKVPSDVSIGIFPEALLTSSLVKIGQV